MKEQLKNRKAYIEWLDLVGQPYRGGGGGVGEFHNSRQIYHQAYDGATNYHDMPRCIEEYYYKALLSMSADIHKEVLRLLDLSITSHRMEYIQKLKAEIDELESIGLSK